MLPSAKLIILTMAAAPLFLAGTVYEGFTGVGVVYVLVLLGLVLLDALVLPRRRDVHVQRDIPDRVSVGYATCMSFRVVSRVRRRVRIELVDDCPADMTVSPNRFEAIIRRGEAVHLTCRLTAHRRGAHRLDRVFVRVHPAGGLLCRQFTVDVPAEIQVFPNVMNVRRSELLARRGSSYERGLARLRQIGQGYEFESLRRYIRGDEISRIEWKATARRASLIVKNYEPESQQNILVAIDVGRATAGEFQGLSRVDYLVNATLMLAYVALRQRDQFSLVAFSDKIESYLPPVSGVKNIERVASALFRLEPRLVESDYGGACRFLGLKNRKRSLLCMMTDVIDRQASDVLIGYMARFARYHLPLAVTLSNVDLQCLAYQPLDDCDDLHAKAAAWDILTARKEALVSMRRSGVSVLDVAPNRLTPELINRYTMIKSARRL